MSEIDAAGLALIARFEKAVKAKPDQYMVFERVFDDVAWRQMADGSVRKGGNGSLLIVTEECFTYERPGYYLEVFL